MDISVPTSPLGIRVLNKLYVVLFYFKHEAQPLGAFLLPKLTFFYRNTLNTDVLALELSMRNILTHIDVARIKATELTFNKNQDLYSIVFAKNAVKELIRSLEGSGNEQIVTELDAMTSRYNVSDGRSPMGALASPTEAHSQHSGGGITINNSGISNVSSLNNVIGKNNFVNSLPTTPATPNSPVDVQKIIAKLTAKVMEWEKKKVDHPLKEVLWDYLDQMAAETYDGGAVALQLRSREILTSTELERINESPENKQNRRMYEYATNKICVRPLVDSLLNTRNFGVLEILMAV